MGKLRGSNATLSFAGPMWGHPQYRLPSGFQINIGAPNMTVAYMEGETFWCGLPGIWECGVGVFPIDYKWCMSDE